MISAIILAFTFVCVAQASKSVNWPDCDPRYVTWHRHPLTCTQYVLCFYGNQIERPCAPGLHFNSNLEQCMLPQLAKCDINYACPDKDDEMNPVYLPNPNDCTRYFVCFNGEPIPRSCAPQLWFDVEFSWCTESDSVTCDSRVPNDPNRPSITSTPGLITTTTREIF